MEQLDYNLLFRWFVGTDMDQPIWAPTVFSKLLMIGVADGHSRAGCANLMHFGTRMVAAIAAERPNLHDGHATRNRPRPRQAAPPQDADSLTAATEHGNISPSWQRT